MQNSLLYSVALHGGIIFFALVALPEPDRLPILPDTALPVELVTIDEFTNLKRVPKAQPPKPEIKPEPEPEPEPEPVRQVAPEPVRETPAADAVPPPPEEDVAEVAEDPRPAPKPVSRPKRPQKPEKKRDVFDPTQISALLNKLPDEPAPKKSEPEPEDDAPDGQFDAKLTLSEIDAFKVQMRRCWSVPAGAANAQNLAVQIRVFLSPDGSLAQAPVLLNPGRLASGDAYFRAAAESAMRAIKRCEPYKMPADKYSRWQELELNFNPKDMLGG